jgi:predicted dehydrogenase
VRRVTGMTRITFPERTITSEPKFGTVIEVDVPTHVAGLLEFANGAIGSIVTSFDVWGGQLPRIEIYGETGTLSVPDPNTFGGPVLLRQAGSREWAEIPLSHGYAENSRGLGVADMAAALRSGRAHRANGEVTYHVLDIMHAIHDSSREGKHVTLQSQCQRPEPMPLGLRDGQVAP